MTQSDAASWVVLKYGGTSVSSRAAWQRIAERVRACQAEGLRPVIVQSALQGVTNQLQSLLELALTEDCAAPLAAILEQHALLARQMQIALPDKVPAIIADTGQILAGIHLVGEVSPRVAAKILSTGELMASLISARYLRQKENLDCAWLDARQVLRSHPGVHDDAHGDYLAASCNHEPDPALGERFRKAGDVILTQGFIAANEKGETVVLGRGGSDTSAACIASLLSASRLEIWSDVPGMFTADPRSVPSARLLRKLEYSEAQEISTMGGKVLHPRCITSVKAHKIPIHLGCAERPDIEGTVISTTGDTAPRVKAVSSKKGITLVSMQTVGMWHHVGFLAEAFECFRRHGFSIDLVSTSETNVTVSLDPADGRIRSQALERLSKDLARICKVSLIHDCAAVSLIGRNIRAILHRLGPVLELFEEHKIHLLTQAASDLNFSVVVDEDQADRLVQQLHGIVIASNEGDDFLGPTWQQVFAGREESLRQDTWWRSKREQLLQLAPVDAAAYVYDLESIDKAIGSLTAMQSLDRQLYAVKANWQYDVLARMYAAGLGFECVSAGEVRHVTGLFPDIDRRRILFTPNFAPADEYKFGFESGVNLTLDSLSPLENWPALFAGQEIFVRLDMGKGRGHHQHVRTAGLHSKFGVPLFELDRLHQLAANADVKITGLHSHAGSGVMNSEHWPEMAEEMAELAGRFDAVKVLDLGGGLGVPEKPGAKGLDVAELDARLAQVKKRWPQYQLWLEPGRYLVAGAGVLLARVTQVKGKGLARFVGLNTGMNSLIRPMLYGAWHEIVNLSRLDEPVTGFAHVVGPICETGDTLGRDRLLPECEVGDVMLIANVGAYGRVMSSNYNLREPAQELVLGQD